MKDYATTIITTVSNFLEETWADCCHYLGNQQFPPFDLLE